MIGRMPVERGADGHAEHRILADRSVDDPAGKCGGQVLRRLEGAAEAGDVLPVDEDRRVVAQCLRLSFANCFEVSQSH